MINLLHGDCLEQMMALEDNSVDSIVTDPPYGLSFMGKKWDIDVPATQVWAEAIRVLKPGGHLISFGGTRTYHRMAVAIEDAGFEIRDMVSWVYGSGFPKSLNIGKAVDKLQGNGRSVVGRSNTVAQKSSAIFQSFNGADAAHLEDIDGNLPITKGTSPWEGWGTALKPAQEPCVLARKPLSEKTVAANVLKWGTGGLNIDGSRVKGEINPKDYGRGGGFVFRGDPKDAPKPHQQGRFPANIIHDGSDEVLEVFPESKSGKSGIRKSDGFNANPYGKNMGIKAGEPNGEYGDSGSAARFFYCAKASKAERNRGCEGLEEKGTDFNKIGFDETKRNRQPRNNVMKNHHPTVKPIALMEYMIKLITPLGGTVLDPFMGSGSTGIAAKNLGHDFIGIEMDVDYLAIAKARIGVQ